MMKPSSLRSRLFSVVGFTSLTGVSFAACVGDDPTGPGGKPNVDAAVDGMAMTQSDGAPVVDGPFDAGAPDPLCMGIAHYWPGEGSGEDLAGTNILDWRPASQNARYALGKFGLGFSFLPAPSEVTSLVNQNISTLADVDVLTIAMWLNADALQYKTLMTLGKGASVSLKIDADVSKLNFSVGNSSVPFAFPNVATYAHVAWVLRKSGAGSSVEMYVEFPVPVDTNLRC
jgi:hypothetical protein